MICLTHVRIVSKLEYEDKLNKLRYYKPAEYFPFFIKESTIPLRELLPRVKLDINKCEWKVKDE